MCGSLRSWPRRRWSLLLSTLLHNIVVHTSRSFVWVPHFFHADGGNVFFLDKWRKRGLWRGGSRQRFFSSPKIWVQHSKEMMMDPFCCECSARGGNYTKKLYSVNCVTSLALLLIIPFFSISLVLAFFIQFFSMSLALPLIVHILAFF